MNKIFACCALLLPLLTACGGGEKATVCVEKEQPYMASRNNPQLKVPDGMTQPNRAEALAIPEPTAGRHSGTGCLDEPPSYFRSSGTTARTPEEVVASWAQAWANREADAVVALYSGSFTAPTDSAGSSAWLEQRREQVATGPVPDPVVEGLRVEPDGADKRVVRFVQKFGTNSLRKELTLVREGASWRIVSEKVADVK
ncbi:Cif family virulence factor [Peristeroidobacter soli]|jgi:hypothetical protein|uniref:nuclear transport factor 2 family protein n=1 Tax=Peristeroidobacter soli TaxID=2497877 RepID=UPI00101C3DCA|nr:nuclear transport factor 2 family protein [Peristeroidobacter soli]